MKPSGTHLCPAPRCPKRVPDNVLLCAEHWRAVPSNMQQAVWRAYRIFGVGSDQHARAVKAVMDHLKSTPQPKEGIPA